MPTDIKHLVANRGYLKASVTRIKKSLEGNIQSLSIENLRAKKGRLDEVFQEYNRVCINILTIDEADTEDPGVIEDIYIDLLAQINTVLAKGNPPSESKSCHISKIKLPNISIPTFSGKYTEYYEFINIFTAMIDKDQSLSSVEKLYYLKSFLNGEPHALINNLPLQSDSYAESLKLLRDRYDNKTKITHEHIYTLLDIPSINRSTPANIRSLISDVKQHLAALKNLDEPVESWDSVVICIVMRKLDVVTSRAFQMDRDARVKPTVLEFLEYLGRRALALEGSDCTQKPQSNRLASHTVAATPPAACPYCKSDHKLFKCEAFALAAPGQRVEFAKKSNLCKVCLGQHKQRKCRFHFKCAECKEGHNSLLHGIDTQALSSVALNNTCNTKNPVLLPTAQVKLVTQSGSIIYARALLDSGSQASFVTQRTLNLLGLIPKHTSSNIVGITNISKSVDKCINLEVHSTIYPFKLNVNCHVVKAITTKLPQTRFDVSSITFPANCKLADANFNVPGDVNLLLGADIFFQILLPPLESTPAGSQSRSASTATQQQPSVVHTAFGHIVAGLTNVANKNNQVVSLYCTECNDSLNDTLKAFWETEKVPEVFPEQLPEHDYCERFFKETTILDNKRFQVSMPIKFPLEQVSSELGQSFHIALKRFINLEKRLHKDKNLFLEYKKFIDQYIELNHGAFYDISRYSLSIDPVYFLPHHAVIKESSRTTKLRTVFDGSMNTNKKVSLNDLLLNGPVVQKDLFEVLLAFRLNKFFFISDIRMMFRCIDLDPKQCSLQNILWRESPNADIQCIQLKTVTYGLKPSSYLATRCLIELADRYEKQFPIASKVLKNNTYVDDILSNSQTSTELVKTQSELIQLLALGGFQLHKWASNCNSVLENVPRETHHFGDLELERHDMSVKTLGINFDVINDTFKASCPKPYISTCDSKREILSYLSSFFDPLGLVGPILTRAKVIMQMLCASQTDWDATPPEDIRTMWNDFVKDLSNMETINIPRCVRPPDSVCIQLIGFADASSMAYGCCLYLRCSDDQGKPHVQLLASKSRINPMRKRLTIARLELNAVLLLAELTAKVFRTLSTHLHISDIHLFSDSQIVLAWLKIEPTKLQAYVANRVRATTEITRDCHWQYVDTKNNPSDCISRGLRPHELNDHKLWWHGPSFLHDKNYVFQVNVHAPPLELPELKCEKNVKVACTTITSVNFNIFESLKKFSNTNKMSRVLSYVIRFCNNAKHDSTKQKGFLTTLELRRSLLLIVKHEQYQYYANEIKCLSSHNQVSGNLKPLAPFLDSSDILRVGGRLQNAPIPYDKKHPVILPKESVVTSLIVRDEHLKLLHAGQKLVLSSIRQRFWIVDGLRTVKKVIHRCVTCFRLKAVAASQLMGSLPAERVTACRPFQKVGVDFAGPVSVKNSRIRKPVISKGYIVLFVCFVTKAIHIELVSDLTTDAFLAAFKRFIARRNLPSDVFCDNGSTFKGARNQLDEMHRLHVSQGHQNLVQSYAAKRGINFHFIPSYSPIFGGLWESGVKSTKHHLKRVVGKALLTYEQLNSVLVEIEGVLNSRPLTALTAEPNDYSFLSPGHFLTGEALNSIPEQNVSDTNVNLLKFWSVITNMKQGFWKNWSKNYLTLLQSRPKWRNDVLNVSIGSLVILRNDNTSPLQWPMARITNVFPGKDGKVRTVEVKTANGYKHNRSITKVCVLPIEG